MLKASLPPLSSSHGVKIWFLFLVSGSLCTDPALTMDQEVCSDSSLNYRHRLLNVELQLQERFIITRLSFLSCDDNVQSLTLTVHFMFV